MTCLMCKNLISVVESANAGYQEARSAPLYMVSTEFAAKMQVDMERAKSALSEHRSCCESVETPAAVYAAAPRSRFYHGVGVQFDPDTGKSDSGEDSR